MIWVTPNESRHAMEVWGKAIILCGKAHKYLGSAIYGSGGDQYTSQVVHKNGNFMFLIYTLLVPLLIVNELQGNVCVWLTVHYYAPESFDILFTDSLSQLITAFQDEKCSLEY